MKKIENYNYSITRDGKIFSHFAGRVLRLQPNNSGYMIANLYGGGDGTSTTFLVHRLVAQTYIPNPDNKPCVNHIDGNKLNNDVSNLEWCTYSENNQHSFDTGLKQGVKSYSDETVHLIFKMIMDGQRVKDICDAVGINKPVYRWIVYGGTYDYIKNEYDFDNRPRKKEAIDSDKVLKICELLEKGLCYQDIHVQTGVDVGKIKNIKGRKTFRMLSESFNF